MRVARLLRNRAADFDVVHDNQTLGYGLLRMLEDDLPVVSTIPHTNTVDGRTAPAAASGWKRRLRLRRWYGFLTMQGRVARRLPRILTVSNSSARDIVTEFGVDPARVQVIPLGVDPEVFRLPILPRVPGRLVAMASADSPMKGISTLLEAFAKLSTERDLELVLVARPITGGVTQTLVERLAITDSVRFVSGLSDFELAELIGSAEIACVPSLYEGFSLPTVEAMACGTPLVVSRGGAIPEVVGEDGLCADLVTPGDVGELTKALSALLQDPARREAMSRAGRRRALERYSWHSVAVATAIAYERVMVNARIDSGAPTDTRRGTTLAHR